MIMTRNTDGTYSQVGFIKDSDGNDTEYIYDKDGTVLFEKGFTREKSGSLPLHLDGIRKGLKDYTLYGNTVQNGAPTPDNPVEVHAVGDRTGNMFDGEWEKGIIDGTTGENTSHDDYVRGKNFIKVFPLTSYRITTTLETDSTFNFLIYEYKSDGSYNLTTNKLGSVFTTNADTHFIRIRTNKTIEVTGEKPEVMVSLNLGTEPLPYEPYGYRIPVETRGKNLILYPYYSSNQTINGVTFTTENDGRIMANGTVTGTVKFYLMCNQKLKAGTYTLSVTRNVPTTNINLQMFDSSKGVTIDGLITSIGSSTPEFIAKTFILNKDTNVDLLYVKSGLTETYIDEYVQLELGSTATEYEPYHEPITTTAYLDKPLYKIGDYADSINYAEQKAERVVKELVLTGEETIWYGSVIGQLQIRFSNIDAVHANAMSTHFAVKSYVTTTGFPYIRLSYNLSNNSTAIWFEFERNIFTSHEEVTEYLSTLLKEQYANGTPVKVYYVLAEPETESVTLPKIPTLDGTTVIDVETEIKPSNMYIKYKSRR